MARGVPRQAIVRLQLAVCTALLLLLLVGPSDGSRLLVPTVAAPSSNGTSSDAALEEAADDEPRNSTAMRCDDARLRCAYRTGCGRALQNYLSRCASVIHGDVNECPEVCQYALIALTSTDEGKELMMCDCAKDDVMCQHSKQRAEICRSSVTTTMNRTRVSCRVATWICNADALCSTALQYYNDYCKRMFHGKKCTKRCLNSINILRRQEKAAKLNTCFCDGAEDYDCPGIHRNMDELCFHRPPQHHKYREHEHQKSSLLRPGDAATAASSAGSGEVSSGGGVSFGSSDVTRTSKTPASGAARVALSGSTSWRILLLGLVLLLHVLPLQSARERRRV